MNIAKALWQRPERLLIMGVLLLALACWVNLFWYLDKVPIANWDEARHGVSAYEMLQSGNYLVNTYRETPDYWNVKPPLSFWAIAAGFKVFGVSVFGFRVVSALCTLLTIALVVLFAGERLSWSTGLLAGGLLVTANRFILSHNARSGDPDALFILLTTSAVFAALQAKEHIRWLYLSCFLLSLGFLTKSFHIGPPALTVMGLALWLRGREIFRLRVFSLCLLYGMAPVLFWAASRYSVDGTAFFEKMWYLDLYNRTTTVVEGHSGGVMYYFKVLKNNFKTPALILAAGLIVLAHYVFYKKHVTKTTFANTQKILLMQLAFCVMLPFVLFQISVSKLGWYIYPVIPFVALLVATTLDAVFRRLWSLRSDNRFKVILICVVVVFCSFQEYRLVRSLLKQTRESDSKQQQLQKLSQEIRGVEVYLEYENWEQKDVLAAKIHGDFIPMDGGLKKWEKDGDATAVLLSSDGRYLTKDR